MRERSAQLSRPCWAAFKIDPSHFKCCWLGTRLVGRGSLGASTDNLIAVSERD